MRNSQSFIYFYTTSISFITNIPPRFTYIHQNNGQIPSIPNNNIIFLFYDFDYKYEISRVEILCPKMFLRSIFVFLGNLQCFYTRKSCNFWIFLDISFPLRRYSDTAFYLFNAKCTRRNQAAE